MNAERDFELLLRISLRAALDGREGPHGRWSSAPAARRVHRTGALSRWNGRMLAVAAAVGLGLLGLLAVGSRIEQHPASRGCPTPADYTVAQARGSAEPTIEPFASMAPDATATTGLLKSGAVAALPDDQGRVGALLRLRDVAICSRLPDARPLSHGDAFVVGNIDLEVLHVGSVQGWIWGSSTPATYRGVTLGSAFLGRFLDNPLVNRRTSLAPPAGFRWSSLVVWEVPNDDGQVTIAYTGPDDSTPPFFSWLVRAGSTDIVPFPTRPSPGASATTGQLRPGDVATIRAANGLVTTMSIDDVDSVARYPGLAPSSAGNVFLEARLSERPDASGERGDFGRIEWRAVDGHGHELTILTDPATPEERLPGVLEPRIPERITSTPGGFSGGAWLIVEAPPTGSVQVQFRLNGEGPVLFTYELRPAAPTASGD